MSLRKVSHRYGAYMLVFSLVCRTNLRESEANATNIEKFMERGRQLWKDIYTPHDVKLANKLASYHPDFICAHMYLNAVSFLLTEWYLPLSVLLLAFIIQSYGTVLSPWPPGDPAHGSGNINRTLTSVVGTACLRTEGGVGPQLTSHVYGLLKSHGDGYADDVATEGDRWLSSEQGTEWVIKTVDELCDVVKHDQSTKSKL